MSLELQIREVDTHLSIRAVGQYSLASLEAVFDRAKEESEKRGLPRVILDVTGVAGTIPVMDKLALGEHCSKIWKPEFRMAIISTAGGVDRFFENVAWNRGAQLAVVPNQAAALVSLR